VRLKHLPGQSIFLISLRVCSSDQHHSSVSRRSYLRIVNNNKIIASRPDLIILDDYSIDEATPSNRLATYVFIIIIIIIDDMYYPL